MAYKRELIINNGSLTSYKKLLKVSDVCQLLDKRTFGTRTEGGTTATYNNDGTFTVSGTATANSWKNFPVFQLLPGGGEHVYLFNVVGISGDTNCYCNIYFYDEIIDRAVELMQTGRESSAVIKKLETPTVYQARFNITTLTGATPNNIVYNPQLFDLTEMYGAGNEPATVAEFKAKFPNDLYDYSPRCWVTSYKTGLIAKTKNLLSEINPWINTKIENGVVHQNTADARELDPIKVQIFNGTTFVKDWYGDNQQIGKNTLTFTTDVLPTHTQIVFGLNGQAADTVVATPITLEDNTTYTLSMDFINITQGEIAWTNSMLEKGSVATDYVPYGYL